jgi:hypothetical protein
MADVVAGFYLTVRLADVGEHPLLIGDVGFDCIGDKEIGAAAGGFGQLREPLFDLRLEADAEGSGGCVRLKHIMARGRGLSGLRLPWLAYLRLLQFAMVELSEGFDLYALRRRYEHLRPIDAPPLFSIQRYRGQPAF